MRVEYKKHKKDTTSFSMSEYIKSKTINKISRLDRYKTSHKLCIKAANFISNIYVKNQNINNAAKNLNVNPKLLRDFLLQADRLNIIDYEYIKFKSRHPYLSKEGLEEQYNIVKCMRKSKNGQRSENVKQVVKLLREHGSLSKVAKLVNMSVPSLSELLKSKYKCRIPTLKRKLKIKKPPSKRVIAKLRRVKKLYGRYHTLQETAKRLHITKERVRQLLKKGSEYGLFEYKLYRESRFDKLLRAYTREDLIKEIKMLISSSKVSIKLNITESEFKKLLEYFNIDYQEYRRIANAGKCLEEYSRIVDTLGYHPATTEMNSRNDWRALWGRINRHWGCMDNFRKEFGIDKPKLRLHPNTIAAFKKRQEQMRLNKKIKKEKMFNFIQQEGPVSSKYICEKLEIGHGTISNYLYELQREGLIIKVGNGSKTQYTTV